MTKGPCILFFLFSCFSVFSQVGIGTTTPTAMLDVNGNVRIRVMQEEYEGEIAKDSMLVLSRNGMVKRISSSHILNSALPSAVKGNFSTNGKLNINLGFGTDLAILPIDKVEFDVKNEFDTASNTFTAKQKGIYNITAQINSNTGIAASLNYGLCIEKNGVIVAKENFSNVAVTILASTIKLTPPARKVSTYVSLSEGDTVKFQLLTDLLTVSLSGDNADSFFSIIQVR